MRSERGTAVVPGGSFVLLDTARNPIALQADAAIVDVSPETSAVVRLSTDLATGHAILTWQPTGRQTAWDFSVKVD